MTPVASRMMRIRMMRAMIQIMAIILIFFHQYFRATFCEVVLKCSDCVEKDTHNLQRVKRSFPPWTRGWGGGFSCKYIAYSDWPKLFLNSNFIKITTIRVKKIQTKKKTRRCREKRILKQVLLYILGEHAGWLQHAHQAAVRSCYHL